tara:strand:- start:3120 stop:3413 length:294 start_codon:yes stop_codon:yes gene_type:complete
LGEAQHKTCLKCGEYMVEGKVSITLDKMNVPTMGPMSTGFMNQGLPPGIETITTSPTWEEKTGKRTGFIFKSDEVTRMKVIGYRCSLCNFIELYAKL